MLICPLSVCRPSTFYSVLTYTNEFLCDLTEVGGSNPSPFTSYIATFEVKVNLFSCH